MDRRVEDRSIDLWDFRGIGVGLWTDGIRGGFENEIKLN